MPCLLLQVVGQLVCYVAMACAMEEIMDNVPPPPVPDGVDLECGDVIHIAAAAPPAPASAAGSPRAGGSSGHAAYRGSYMVSGAAPYSSSGASSATLGHAMAWLDKTQRQLVQNVVRFNGVVGRAASGGGGAAAAVSGGSEDALPTVEWNDIPSVISTGNVYVALRMRELETLAARCGDTSCAHDE